MPRYVALLRGVSPMNARMPELKRCFEGAGFTNVKTVLSSGNVVFDARSASEASLEKKIEAAMQASLGRTFYTIVRSASFLRRLVETDPYSVSAVPKNAKRVVSFLREPGVPKLALPHRIRRRADPGHCRPGNIYRLCSERQGACVHEVDREGFRNRCHYADMGNDQEMCGSIETPNGIHVGAKHGNPETRPHCGPTASTD